MASPRITSIEWGRMDIESADITCAKDCKLYPGGAKAWDWQATGTRHHPGIQYTDVEDLVKAGAQEIVLSRGMDLKLGVPNETIQWLKDRDIDVHVAETRQAVSIYNGLVDKGVKVGGLFHSTC